MSTNPTQPITVVSGLPRSGTSLMMQMLVAGGLSALTDDQRPADDSNQRGYLEYAPVAQTRSDPSWVPEARGKVVKIISPLIASLPLDECYRVIVMTRSIDHMIESQAAMLARLEKPGATMPRETLAAAFRAQLRQVLQYMDERDAFRVHTVDFDRLVENPGAEAEQLVAFLKTQDGTELDAAPMIDAVDPSLRHHRS